MYDVPCKNECKSATDAHYSCTDFVCNWNATRICKLMRDESNYVSGFVC